MDLFIPTKIHKDSIFGKGFGKKEMLQTIIGAGIGGIIGLIIGFIFFSTIQKLVMRCVLSLFIAGAVSYFFFIKNDNNLSVYDYCRFVFKYFHRQKYFSYQKLIEWR